MSAERQSAIYKYIYRRPSVNISRELEKCVPHCVKSGDHQQICISSQIDQQRISPALAFFFCEIPSGDSRFPKYNFSTQAQRAHIVKMKSYVNKLVDGALNGVLSKRVCDVRGAKVRMGRAMYL